MTVLTLRYQRRHFTVSGPDIEMRKFEHATGGQELVRPELPGLAY